MTVQYGSLEIIDCTDFTIWLIEKIDLAVQYGSLEIIDRPDCTIWLIGNN